MLAEEVQLTGHEDGPLAFGGFSLETKKLLHDFKTHEQQSCWDRANIRMRQLEEEILALKQACNDNAPIERLPLEILTHIFNILRGRSLVADEDDWLVITRVCAGWRAAALNCADLWADIDFSRSPGMVEAMLQRSEEASLFLRFDARLRYASEQKSIRFRQTLLHFAKRLRSVTVFLGSRTYFSRLLALKTFPLAAPNLETIHFEAADKFWQRLPKWFGQRAYLSLRQLTIAGFSIQWQSLPTTPRLTFLKLGSDGKHRPSMKAFMRSLCSLHELKHLDLSGILPDNDNFSLSKSSSLPTLQSLVLDDGADQISNFFSSCHTIICNRVHLTVLGNDRVTSDGNNSVVGCLKALSRAWKDPTSASPRAEGGVHSVKLVDFDQELWDPCIECTFQPDSDEAELSLVFNNPTTNLASHPVIDLARSLDLNPLHSLFVHDCDHIPGAIWNAAFSELTKLETLEFVQSSIETFVAALAEGAILVAERTKPYSGLKRVVVKGVSSGDRDMFTVGNLVTLVTSPHIGVAAALEELHIVNKNISRLTDYHIKSGQAGWKIRVVLKDVQIVDISPNWQNVFERFRSFACSQDRRYI